MTQDRNGQKRRIVESVVPAMSLTWDSDRQTYAISQEHAILLRRAAIQQVRSWDRVLGWETEIARKK